MTEEVEKDQDQASLGETLRQRRLEKGFALETISAVTRVPQRFLEAMEADCFEDLPGQPYAAGFVRGYARYLGLSENEILERYKCEAKPCRAEPVFRVSEPVVTERLPSRAMVLGGMITAVAAYSIWFSLNATATSDIAGPILPDRELASLELASKGEQSLETNHRSIIEKIEPAAEGAIVVAAMVPRAEIALAETSGEDAETVVDASPSEEAVVVEVLEDAWVHITRGDEILYTGVMKAGRRYKPDYAAGVELTTGNAGGVVLHLGNWSSGPLGQTGRVRRDVSLDPQDWRGMQVAQDHS